MSCDVGEVTERLENEQRKRRKGWRMSCDVGEVENALLLIHLASRPCAVLSTKQMSIYVYEND